jgi:poly-gamma-glutamate capsule biosynthesis protein CapA/YwtB (metallophosphatase superfamily)
MAATTTKGVGVCGGGNGGGAFYIVLVGDVMLGRLIDQLRPTHVENPSEHEIVSGFARRMPMLSSYCARTPWGNTLRLFRSAHLNLINLETSVTTHDRPWPHKAFNYRMHPANVDFLTEAKVDYASLANNHTLDFCEPGLVETVDTLAKTGIEFAGAGKTREKAVMPAELCLRRGPDGGRHPQGGGVSKEEATVSEQGATYRVHVYSASDHPSDWKVIPTFHFFDYTSAERGRLKAQLVSYSHSHDSESGGGGGNSNCDLKVFSVHWGPNYQLIPDPEIRSLAHFLIDECGVDVVHGHSSHHIQGVETYKGKIIIYGCGDFVDDYSIDQKFRNDLGAVWRLKVVETTTESGNQGEEEGGSEKKKLRVERLEIFPTRIALFQTNIIDKNDDDWKYTRRRLEQLSMRFDTQIRTEDDILVVDV